MKKKVMQRKLMVQAITTILFVAFIFIFAILNLFSVKKDFSENENRFLSPAPNFSIKNILFGNFDNEFESWFSDHFIARDSWITLKAKVKQMSGSIENNQVYFGEDGKLIKQFFHYDQKIVDNNIQYIQEFSDEYDVKINIMIIPEASYINQDDLPIGSYNIDEKKLIDDIQEKLSTQTIIDVSEVLMNSDEDLYFHSDHHWNEKGAKIAYDQICKIVLQKKPLEFKYTQVSNSFYGTMYSRSGAFWIDPDAIIKMEPIEPLKLKLTFEDGTTSDTLFIEKNLDEKDKYKYYLDGNHSHITINTENKNGKTAIIVKDSFAHILLPYLAPEYEKIEIFDLRYFHDEVSSFIKDKENTDIYIIYSTDTFTSDSNLSMLW